MFIDQKCCVHTIFHYFINKLVRSYFGSSKVQNQKGRIIPNCFCLILRINCNLYISYYTGIHHIDSNMTVMQISEMYSNSPHACLSYRGVSWICVTCVVISGRAQYRTLPAQRPRAPIRSHALAVVTSLHM